MYVEINIVLNGMSQIANIQGTCPMYWSRLTWWSPLQKNASRDETEVQTKVMQQQRDELEQADDR